MAEEGVGGTANAALVAPPAIYPRNERSATIAAAAPFDNEYALRARLAAAADYGQEVCAAALSPCARDLAWWLCRIGNAHAEVPADRLQRELTRAERLWRACMEVELLESGNAGL